MTPMPMDSNEETSRGFRVGLRMRDHLITYTDYGSGSTFRENFNAKLSQIYRG